MSKFKIKLISSGVRQVLKRKETKTIIDEYGKKTLDRCGTGYEETSHNYPERYGVSIYPATLKAKLDNEKNNTLERAIR